MSGEGVFLNSTVKTPAHIAAEGDARSKIVTISIIGAIDGILALGGVVLFFVNPDRAKDLWVITGPIITGTLTAASAILINDKSKKK